MDFSKVSFDATWTDNKEELEENSTRAKFYAVLFAFTASQLIIAIVRTISTNPGNIPDHREWDMATDSSAPEDNAPALASTEAGS